MSNYIIELGEDANMVQVISVTQSGNAYIDSTVYVGCLEHLNSDYINEHFSDLQDTAYHRGFEKGKDVRIKGCEGCMYQDTTIEHNPCNLCCNAFLNRWTAKKKADDEIKVGDEVEIIGTGNKFFIVGYEDDCICGFAYGGKTCRVDPVFAKKTGKHIDLNSILEEMKNESQKSNE